MPVPDRLTFCGEPPPLSLIFNVASRVPVAAGVKVTLIVQLAAAARLDPHGVELVTSAKSIALVPLIVMLLIVRAEVPRLVIVTNIGTLVVPTVWLPKLTLVADKLTIVPVQVNVTTCGLLEALSVTASEAVRLCTALGVKVILTLQVVQAGTGVPHVLVWAKSLLFVPVNAMLVMFAPWLVRVTALVALVVPTS